MGGEEVSEVILSDSLRQVGAVQSGGGGTAVAVVLQRMSRESVQVGGGVIMSV